MELEGLYVIPQMSPRAMHEGAQLKHQHKGIKKKGGNPPVDYRVIEDKIDLERALQVADFLEVLRLYFRLRRTVRW